MTEKQSSEVSDASKERFPDGSQLPPGNSIPFGNIPTMPTQEAVDGIRFDFNDGARVWFPPEAKSYRVRFTDLDNMVTLYDGVTPSGGKFYVTSQKKFFVRWRIIISTKEKDELVFSHDFDATGKEVNVRFPVHTLGDTIGWFSYVERFQKKHRCQLNCVVSPWFVELVAKQYPDLRFLSVAEAETRPAYANYNIGIFGLGDNDHQEIDHRFVGLHRLSAHILGVEDSDEPPRFDLSAPRMIPEKYVCIAALSSSQAKYWNTPFGWMAVVKFLKDNGYCVLCIDKEKVHGTSLHWNYIKKRNTICKFLK